MVYLTDKKVYLTDKKVYLTDKKVYLLPANAVHNGVSGLLTAYTAFIALY